MKLLLLSVRFATSLLLLMKPISAVNYNVVIPYYLPRYSIFILSKFPLNVVKYFL